MLFTATLLYDRHDDYSAKVRKLMKLDYSQKYFADNRDTILRNCLKAECYMSALKQMGIHVSAAFSGHHRQPTSD